MPKRAYSYVGPDETVPLLSWVEGHDVDSSIVSFLSACFSALRTYIYVIIILDKTETSQSFHVTACFYSSAFFSLLLDN